MEVFDMKSVRRDLAQGLLPEGEVADFLREWYDGKEYVVGHTSGSTGMPKEIRLGKGDMRASARMTNAFFGIGDDSVLLLCLSVSYIAGKMMVVRALEAGAELWVVRPGAHPLAGVECGRERRVDLAAMVPMQVEASMEEEREWEAFSRVRQLLVGGAPVSASLEKRLGTVPTVAYATYGMTETVSHVALRRIGQGEVYFALGEVTFAADGRGCLVIDAPHLRERRFVTNDVAEVQDPCHFRWLGRWDNVINSGGLKFFPERIEAKIAAVVPGRFFIASRPDTRLGERIVLVLEGTADDYPLAQTQLLERCREVLSPYEMPREVVYLPRFSETSSGKVIRRVSPA